MQLRPLLGQSENAFDHDVQLYVEGQDDSLDPTILDALFIGKRVLVQPIGSCNSVECVAQAFEKTDHRGAFFLVDRDYHHQGEVLDWSRFQNGETNLIVWRKKELESYFIDPVFLEQSEFIQNRDQLRERLLAFCQRRLFLEVANYVIVTIRETMKQNWIQLPTDCSRLADYDSALESLLNLPGFGELRNRAESQTTPDHITSLFNQYFNEISGGRNELEFGHGQWLNMMSGKVIFQYLLSNSGLFPATLRETGESGRAKMNTVGHRLLKTSSTLPQDFTELREMVIRRADNLINNPNT